MSYSPLKSRELKKRGIIIDEKQFFMELASACNYVDEKTVRSFYGELVRLITKQLKTKGVSRLPYLGDFAIIPQKPQYKFFGNIRKLVTGGFALKFYAKPTWRKYFDIAREDVKNGGTEI